MRFSVPQFIDVEDKIFGPLTLKQGIYIIGGGGAAYLIYALGGIAGVVLVGIPLFGLAVLFAFVKINNRPFVEVASAAFFYYIKNKLYLWKRTPTNAQQPQATQSTASSPAQVTPKLTPSKLRALAFSLDTEGGYQPENE